MRSPNTRFHLHFSGESTSLDAYFRHAHNTAVSSCRGRLGFYVVAYEANYVGGYEAVYEAVYEANCEAVYGADYYFLGGASEQGSSRSFRSSIVFGSFDIEARGSSFFVFVVGGFSNCFGYAKAYFSRDLLGVVKAEGRLRGWRFDVFEVY